MWLVSGEAAWLNAKGNAGKSSILYVDILTVRCTEWQTD